MNIGKCTKLLAAAALTISLAVLSFACSSEPPDPAGQPTDLQYEISQGGPSSLLPDGSYPTNDKGLTYGTLFDYWATGILPDLIEVMASNGQFGYITGVDYVMSLRETSSPQAAEAQMEAQREGAVQAFCECVQANTGSEVDAVAFRELLDQIYDYGCVESPWVLMSEENIASLVSLLPEGFRTLELAQQAWESANAANDIVIPVYALDGVTYIGDFVVE